MDEFLVHAAPRNADSFPFVVLGNKADLAKRRQVNLSRAQQWCQSKGDIPHYETSAKEAVNVDQAFHTIARNALAQEAKSAPIYVPPSNPIKISEDNTKTNGGGCCS